MWNSSSSLAETGDCVDPIIIFGIVVIPGDSELKNLPVSIGDVGLIPGSGRSPGVGNSNPLQYSYLGNPIDGEAQLATVNGVTKELDLTKQLNNKSDWGFFPCGLLYDCQSALPKGNLAGQPWQAQRVSASFPGEVQPLATIHLTNPGENQLARFGTMPTHVNRSWGSEKVVEIMIIDSLRSRRRAVSQKKKSTVPRRERKTQMSQMPAIPDISIKLCKMPQFGLYCAY